MVILQTHDLRFHTLGPIDLTVESNERLVISGASGAGKTLLLRAIVDLDPHEGEVTLNNKSSQLYSPTQWRKTVGLLLAESAWWYDTVEPHFSKIEPDLLNKLGFELSILKRKINGLSTGERQRLALLRLLANQPAVLLLDEITANLDNENTLLMEELILLYQQQQEAAIIWISHNKEQINRVATRHLVLKDGTVHPKSLEAK